MSEEKLDDKIEDRIEELVEKRLDDDVEIDQRIETVSSTSAPWFVRVIFGLLGIILIASAIAAWQYREMFDGQIAQSLPWIIGGLAVLGVGAIVESITTELWITIIVSIAALAVTFLIVGRTQIVPQDGAIYTVDRFTGAVQLCTPDGCLPLKQVTALPKPPPPPPMAEPVPPPPPVAAPVPAPAPVAAAPAKPAKK